MKSFSENNSIQYNPVFINIVHFLNQTFLANSISLLTEENLTIQDIRFDSYNPCVSMVDSVIENNFRLIESYLPELLFALSTVSKQNDSINNCISKLSKNKFPYKNSRFSKLYLRHKMVYFIEVLLFAGIYNGVWKGEFISNKCYVHKDNSILCYYHYYEIRPLLLMFLDRICMLTEKKVDDNKCCITITFQLIPVSGKSLEQASAVSQRYS